MITVFGATGFIGSNYCNLYSDTIKIQRELSYPCSKDILYLISTVDNYNIFTNPYIDIETNLIKLISVLENCKDKDVVFNFISSWFVYGDCEQPKLETDPCNPRGFYSVTKHTAERIVEEYCTTFNIPYRILRLPNVIGEGDQKSSDKKNVLQNVINKLKLNQPVQLFDGGTFKRDYMHVIDVCRAIDLIIRTGQLNSIYNVGTGFSMKFVDLVELARLEIVSHSRLEIVETPDKFKNFQLNACLLNVDKLKGLGYTHTIDPYQSILRMINDESNTKDLC